MESTASWDPRNEQWIVLDVDASEGGPERAWLLAVTPAAHQELATGATDESGLRELARAAEPFEHLAPARDLIVALSESQFSLDTYASMVELSGPLRGWLLEISTNDDLDAPMHVLTLIRCADGGRIELGRREATHTPCDGDGWYCSARQEEECTAAELRAEGRLCIAPLGITHVAVSGDRFSLLVQGVRHTAGHGGYPPFHWVVPLPTPS